MIYAIDTSIMIHKRLLILQYHVIDILVSYNQYLNTMWSIPLHHRDWYLRIDTLSLYDQHFNIIWSVSWHLSITWVTPRYHMIELFLCVANMTSLFQCYDLIYNHVIFFEFNVIWLHLISKETYNSLQF